jgi:hypothetical protein
VRLDYLFSRARVLPAFPLDSQSFIYIKRLYEDRAFLYFILNLLDYSNFDFKFLRDIGRLKVKKAKLRIPAVINI